MLQNIHPNYKDIQFDYPLNLEQLEKLATSYSEFKDIVEDISTLEETKNEDDAIKSSFEIINHSGKMENVSESMEKL